MWYGYPQYPQYPQGNTYRPGISDIFGCLNKWGTIKFTDGTNVQAYLSSADFIYATGYLTRNSYRSLTCKGTAIQNAQQAEGCKNQWVTLTLPNNINLSFYLTYYTDQMIGGSLQTSQLLPLSNQIATIQC